MPNLFKRHVNVTLYEVEPNPDPVMAGAFILKEPKVKRELFLSPYTIADIEAMDIWVRKQILDKFIATAREMPRDLISREDFLQLVADEAKKVSQIGWSSDEGLKLLATVDGLVAMLWQVLHKGSDLTREELKCMVMVGENQEAVLDAIKTMDNLDMIGIPHPTEAHPEGQIMSPEMTSEKETLPELVRRVISNTSSTTTQDTPLVKS